MSDQPDYVNDLPDEYPEDTPRCQRVFRYSHEYGERDVKGRMCGLPVEDETGLCYWHVKMERKGDADLKLRLKKAVAAGFYLGEAHLLRAQLQGADLSYGQLQDADLRYAYLQGASLWCAKLQGANLLHAQLLGAALRGAELQGADLRGAKLQNVDLRNARIGVLQIHDPATNMSTRRATALSGADLTGALLTRIDLEPEANLDDAKIDCPIRDEMCVGHDAEWDKAKDLHGGGRPTFEECEVTYRQLKLNLQQSGDYDGAGEFFEREMECRRAQAAQKLSLWNWLFLSLLYHLCGYGERPWKALCWAVAVLVIFSFPLGWMGIMCGERVMAEPGIALPSWAGLNVFFWAFCLSLASLVGGDLGQLRTVSAYGDCVLAVETAIGWLLLSIFMVALARKFSR